MQNARRKDPYPWTWELPAAIVSAILIILVFGIHIGRCMANLFAGGGWTWPAREELFRSLPGVVMGNAAEGLPHSGLVAGQIAVWTWIGLTELTLLVAAVCALKKGMDRWGPGRLHGMASRSEAEQLLGRTRLRRAGPLVRPDIYGEEWRTP